MLIGELARRAGCPVDTVRYYEKEGLVPRARRSAGNYRVYGPEHAERLAFIRRCRSLDMSLPEIRALLAAVVRPDADCAPVNALLDEHIGHVSDRISELKRLKTELLALRARCANSRRTAECGILTTLGHSPYARSQQSHVAAAHGVRPRAIRHER